MLLVKTNQTLHFISTTLKSIKESSEKHPISRKVLPDQGERMVVGLQVGVHHKPLVGQHLSGMLVVVVLVGLLDRQQQQQVELGNLLGLDNRLELGNLPGLGNSLV